METQTAPPVVIEASFEEVNQLLGEIVAERPDFQYTYEAEHACTYAPREEDGSRCLIGELLSRLGWTDEQLYELDQIINGGIKTLLTGCSENDIEILSKGNGNKVDPRILTLLKQVQSGQDGGDTWGNALKQARQAVKDLHGLNDSQLLIPI